MRRRKGARSTGRERHGRSPPPVIGLLVVLRRVVVLLLLAVTDRRRLRRQLLRWPLLPVVLLLAIVRLRIRALRVVGLAVIRRRRRQLLLPVIWRRLLCIAGRRDRQRLGLAVAPPLLAVGRRWRDIAWRLCGRRRLIRIRLVRIRLVRIWLVRIDHLVLRQALARHRGVVAARRAAGNGDAGIAHALRLHQAV